MGMLVETPLPSEIHGPTLVALITDSVVLKTAVLKEKKNGFLGTPCEETGSHQSYPREELAVEMGKGHYFINQRT